MALWLLPSWIVGASSDHLWRSGWSWGGYPDWIWLSGQSDQRVKTSGREEREATSELRWPNLNQELLLYQASFWLMSENCFTKIPPACSDPQAEENISQSVLGIKRLQKVVTNLIFLRSRLATQTYFITAVRVTSLDQKCTVGFLFTSKIHLFYLKLGIPWQYTIHNKR